MNIAKQIAEAMDDQVLDTMMGVQQTKAVKQKEEQPEGLEDWGVHEELEEITDDDVKEAVDHD